MFSLRLLFAAGLIGAALATPALADEKPAAEVKTKAIEAMVVIDAKLKAYPALYTKLLADGKREMTKWRVDADNEYKKNPQMFRDGRPWEFTRDYSVRSVIGSYVSVLRNDGMDGGGAHPNRTVDTLLWDAKANKLINIRPFFKETADNGPTMTALAKAIRAAVAAEKKARDIEVKDPDTDESLASVKAKITDLGGIALTPSTEAGKSSGFAVYFSPYAVGPYVEGEYTVFIPWTVFKDQLSPEGAALFAGERPKDDAKDE